MNHSTRLRCAAAVATALFAAACDTGPGANRTAASASGDLGKGRFVYRCDSSTPECNDSGDAQAFPEAVALGGTFNLEFLPIAKSDMSGITLETASNDFLSRAPGGFSAQKVGAGTVIARNASGAIIDFTSITIRAAHAIGVYEAAADAPRPSAPAFSNTIDLTVDARKSLRAVARTATAAMLAGELGFEWTSADPTIFSVETFSEDGVTVRGRKEGATKLFVEGAGKKQEIAVIVSKGATQ